MIINSAPVSLIHTICIDTPVPPGPFCNDICFAADDRLDAVLRRFFIKLQSAEHNSMIRHSDSRHILFESGFDERFDSCRAV